MILHSTYERALRAEIDEAAWSTRYSTVSRPFPKPESGKITAKVHVLNRRLAGDLSATGRAFLRTTMIVRAKSKGEV